MAGRPPKSEWISQARRYRSALALAKDGEREADLQALAGDADVNTLRRAIRALDLLDRWGELHADAFQRLILTPQTVLEVFAAWDSVDEAAAWKAYEKWEKKPTPVNDLAEKLRLFRFRKGFRGNRGLKKDLRKETSAHVRSMVGHVLGPDVAIGSVKENVKVVDEPMMDFLVSATIDQRACSIAIVIVGPYRNSVMYGKRKLEWFQRALALAWIHDHVILVLDDNDYVGTYEDWTRKFAGEVLARPGCRPSVHVIASEPVTSRTVR